MATFTLREKKKSAKTLNDFRLSLAEKEGYLLTLSFISLAQFQVLINIDGWGITLQLEWDQCYSLSQNWLASENLGLQTQMVKAVFTKV